MFTTILKTKKIDELYIVNPSGGMIFSNLSNVQLDHKMIFCSSFHSLYEIAKLITLFPLKDQSNDKNKSPYSFYKYDDSSHFRMIFVSTNQTITMYKTPTDILFIFISKKPISHDCFLKIYSEYFNKIILNPLYILGQPIITTQL